MINQQVVASQTKTGVTALSELTVRAVLNPGDLIEVIPVLKEFIMPILFIMPIHFLILVMLQVASTFQAADQSILLAEVDGELPPMSHELMLIV